MNGYYYLVLNKDTVHYVNSNIVPRVDEIILFGKKQFVVKKVSHICVIEREHDASSETYVAVEEVKK